jgi:fumarate reductase subunit D
MSDGKDKERLPPPVANGAGGTTEHTLENKTARNIIIEAREPQRDCDMVVCLFGRRRMDMQQMNSYSWQKWQQHGFVAVWQREEPKPRHHPMARWMPPALGEMVAALLIPLLALLLPALFLGAALNETTGSVSLSNFTSVLLFILLLFIIIIASLPAALFFLFKRRLVYNLWEDFLRDALRLHPAAQTTEDVEALYGAALEEAHGCDREGHSPLNVYIPIWLSTFLFSFGWSLLLLPTINQIASINSSLADIRLHDIIIPALTPVGFAFLGSYFFALNFTFRRYVRSDLGPKAYTHLNVRVLSAIILAWVLELLPIFDGGVEGGYTPLMLIIAFAIGIMPETARAILQDFLMQQPFGRWIPSLRKKLPLTKLEGITLYDQTRLLEEGIDNIENVAHHDLITLMLNTRIPTARLVDLVDQAILYLHVHDLEYAYGQDEELPAALRRLREYGIRTATDLEIAYLAAARRGEEAAFLNILEDGQTPPAGIARLRVILDTLADDDWMPLIRCWHDPVHATSKSFKLEELAPPEPPARQPA